MKPKIIIPIVLVLAIFGSLAFVMAKKAPAAQADHPVETYEMVTGGAKAQFETELIDLGEIPHRVHQNLTFDFVNVGDQDLIIEEVKKSCGCTQPDWIKTPVKPGEKGWVAATFTAPSTGVQSKTITVRSNDQDNPIKVLYFKAEVMASEDGNATEDGSHEGHDH